MPGPITGLTGSNLRVWWTGIRTRASASPGNLAAFRISIPWIPPWLLFVRTLSRSVRTETHRDLTIQALKAGRHVFVEKPIAMTVDHAGEIAGRRETGKKVVWLHPAPPPRVDKLLKSPGR